MQVRIPVYMSDFDGCRYSADLPDYGGIFVLQAVMKCAILS